MVDKYTAAHTSSFVRYRGRGRIQNQEQYYLERAYLKAALNLHKNDFFQREVLLMLWYNYLSELYEMYSSDPFENQLRDALTIGVDFIPLNSGLTHIVMEQNRD